MDCVVEGTEPHGPDWLLPFILGLGIYCQTYTDCVYER